MYIYLYLSISISIYLYLSLSISIYLYLSISIYIYLNLSIYRSIDRMISSDVARISWKRPTRAPWNERWRSGSCVSPTSAATASWVGGTKEESPRSGKPCHKDTKLGDGEKTHPYTCWWLGDSFLVGLPPDRVSFFPIRIWQHDNKETPSIWESGLRGSQRISVFLWIGVMISVDRRDDLGGQIDS